MGLHQDRDEQDFAAPVLSVSLGDTAIFRIGGTSRGGQTTSLKLNSGDVCLLAGPARLAFHGIDRVLEGSSTVVPGGGRLNLTLRRAR
jgi:alkylated DNA repair protein (DNA oxidative demethylase)